MQIISREVAMRLLFVFARCFLTGALLMAQGQPTPDGPIQARNKAVAMRVFDEIFNKGKFQVADEIYAPDFGNHGLHRSVDLKTDQDAVHAEKKAFPDLRMSVQEMVAEGDKVAVLWTFQGTHTGSGYEGLPPTGTRVEVRGTTIWRIVEDWSGFSDTGAYILMFAHLKWWLVFVGLLVLAIVIALERLIWRVARKMFAYRLHCTPDTVNEARFRVVQSVNRDDQVGMAEDLAQLGN
jgi:predicted ester cyclase